MNRILIVGCGDIALRIAPLLIKRYQLYGLARNRERFNILRNAGITPVPGNLDVRSSFIRIAGLADTVLHFAPPPNEGETDMRTRHLLAALGLGRLPRQLIYLSTSGVYGDCAGEFISESVRVNPQTKRAQRRADAEVQLRAWAARTGVPTSILRVPGIYAAERLPLERLRLGIPAIRSDEDSHTNHIHADDLARIVVAAMHRGKPNRIYHASDDSNLKMGDYFDVVADAFGLPRPPRMLRAEASRVVAPSLWSFMSESRRLDNYRMKRELGIVLHYPSVLDMLKRQAGLPG